MKKILIIFAILLFVLIAALAVTPMFFKGKITEIVKSKAQEQLNADLDFQDIGLSLIRDFPRLSLTIDGLSLINRKPFAGDTLIYFESFNTTLDPIRAIFGESIQILSINLNQPKINLMVLEDKRSNWDIFKAAAEDTVTAEEAQSRMQLVLQEYEIKDAKIRYADRSNGSMILAGGLHHSGKADVSQSIVNWQTHTTINSLTAGFAGINYLNGVETELGLDLSADLAENAITIQENRLRINNLILNLSGQFQMVEDLISIDLEFGTEATDFRELVSLVPTIYKKGIADLKASGRMELHGIVKGRYGEDQFPSFDLQMTAEEGMIQYPGMPDAVNNIDLDFAMSNPGGDLDKTKIELKKLHFEMAQQPFDASFTIQTPISGAYGAGRLAGRLDLARLQSLLPLETGESIEGQIHSDLETHIRTRDKETTFLAKGLVDVTRFSYSSPTLPEKVAISKATLRFTEDWVSLSDLNLSLGESDIQANGRLENLMSYMLKDGTMTGRLSLTSNYLNLNPWITDDSDTLTAVVLPDRIEFVMDGNFKRVTFDNLDLENVRGTLLLKDRAIDLKDMTMGVLGGSMTANGTYDTSQPDKPTAGFDLKMSQIDINESFTKFATVRAFAPIAQRMVGKFDAQLQLNIGLRSNLLPVWSSLESSGRLEIAQASLIDFKPLNQISSVTGLERLHNPVVSNLRPSFSIRNGRFTTQPFDIKIDQYSVRVSGSHGIDRSLDYSLKFTVPSNKLSNQAATAINNLLGNKNAAQQAESIDLLVSLGGTFSDPTVKTSVGEIVKSVADNAKDALIKGITDKLKINPEQSGNEKKRDAVSDSTDKKPDLKDILNKEKEKLEEEKKKAGEKLKNKIKEIIKP